MQFTISKRECLKLNNILSQHTHHAKVNENLTLLECTESQLLVTFSQNTLIYRQLLIVTIDVPIEPVNFCVSTSRLNDVVKLALAHDSDIRVSIDDEIINFITIENVKDDLTRIPASEISLPKYNNEIKLTDGQTIETSAPNLYELMTKISKSMNKIHKCQNIQVAISDSIANVIFIDSNNTPYKLTYSLFKPMHDSFAFQISSSNFLNFTSQIPRIGMVTLTKTKEKVICLQTSDSKTSFLMPNFDIPDTEPSDVIVATAKVSTSDLDKSLESLNITANTLRQNEINLVVASDKLLFSISPLYDRRTAKIPVIGNTEYTEPEKVIFNIKESETKSLEKVLKKKSKPNVLDIKILERNTSLVICFDFTSFQISISCKRSKLSDWDKSELSHVITNTKNESQGDLFDRFD